jgi:hypothetical protein
LWSPYNDGVDYSSIDTNTFRGESDGTIFAAGDTFGRVRLFRWPALNSVNAIGKTYWAGSSPITRVRWHGGDSSLLVTTGKEKIILQYRHVRDRDTNIAFGNDHR